MKRTLMMAVALAVLGTAMVPGGAAAAGFKNSGDVVKAAAAPAVVSGAAGQRIEFAIALDIASSWHIYAHGDTNFIGVDLVPSEDFPLEKFEAAYPAGHEAEFFGEKVVMISGQDRIKAAAVIPAGLAAGEHALTFGVTVQACDDKTCLAPVDLPITVKLKVQ